MSEIDKPIEQSTSPVAKPENWERFGPREHEPCEHGIFDFEDCRACRARLRAAIRTTISTSGGRADG